MKTKLFPFLSSSAFALCAAIMLVPHTQAEDKKDRLTGADEKFVKQEAAAGMATVKIAEFGVKKTERADIKAFSETLVTDHTAANAELAKLAASKNVELSTVIDPKHAETYQKLEKHSGTDFDKEYLATLVKGHEKCVSNFEEASKDSSDGDLKAWAGKMLPALKAHLEKAKELAAK